jgi:hypothetical protein
LQKIPTNLSLSLSFSRYFSLSLSLALSHSFFHKILIIRFQTQPCYAKLHLLTYIHFQLLYHMYLLCTNVNCKLHFFITYQVYIINLYAFFATYFNRVDIITYVTSRSLRGDHLPSPSRTQSAVAILFVRDVSRVGDQHIEHVWFSRAHVPRHLKHAQYTSWYAYKRMYPPPEQLLAPVHY